MAQGFAPRSPSNVPSPATSATSPSAAPGSERQPAATHPRCELDEHAATAEQHNRAEIGARLQPDEGFALTTDERLHDDGLGQVVGARDRAQLEHDGSKVVVGHVDADRVELGAVRCVGELDDQAIAELPRRRLVVVTRFEQDVRHDR